MQKEKDQCSGDVFSRTEEVIFSDMARTTNTTYYYYMDVFYVSEIQIVHIGEGRAFIIRHFSTDNNILGTTEVLCTCYICVFS